LEGLRKVAKTLPEDAACEENYEAGITKYRVGMLSGKPRVSSKMGTMCYSRKSDLGTLVPRITVENGIKLGFLLE
jgi:hypothetical protein